RRQGPERDRLPLAAPGSPRRPPRLERRRPRPGAPPPAPSAIVPVVYPARGGAAAAAFSDVACDYPRVWSPRPSLVAWERMLTDAPWLESLSPSWLSSRFESFEACGGLLGAGL